MSTAVISYSSLKQSATKAKETASKLDSYASALNSQVYQKLTACSWSSGNLGSAQTLVSGKISLLEEKSAAFTDYSAALTELRDQCKKVDAAVKSRVSGLTASFKADHGISSNAVIDTISFLLTYADDQCVLFRAASNALDEVGSLCSYILQYREDWLDYEGGSDLIEAVRTLIISGVVAVCSFVIALGAVSLSAPVLAIAAAVVGVAAAAIGVFNVVVDFANECRAYYQTCCEEDPAYGQRLSDENTIQDVLRTETASPELYALADGIDIFLAVSAIISAAKGLADFAKSTSGWISVNGSSFTFDPDDFVSALEQKYVSGDSIKAVKNWGSLAQTMLSENFELYNTVTSGDYTISDLAEAAADDSLLNTLIWSNLSVDAEVTYEDGTSGAKTISLSSITGAIKSVEKIESSVESIYDLLFVDDSLFGEELLEKLSEISDIEIQVPDICIPKVEFDLDCMFASAA